VRIHLKSKDEISLMREAGLVAAAILDQVCEAAKPGVSTWELDDIARRGIAKHKVTSAFLNYNPGGKPKYPAVLCTSRNEVIVHGIPRKSDVLADGDIIGIDFGIFRQGFCADTARTLLIGNVSAGARGGDPAVPPWQPPGRSRARSSELRGIARIFSRSSVRRPRNWPPDARGPPSA